MRAERVILISHLARPGEVTGAERSLLNVGRGLAAEGRQVSFVAPLEGDSVQRARELGFAVQVTPWPRLFLSSWQASPVASLARAARFIAGSYRLPGLATRLGRAARPAVALVNTAVNVGAAWAARRAGLGVVCRIAEIPGPGLRRTLLRRGLERSADRIVTVSQAVADHFGLAGARVIHSGVLAPSGAAIAASRRALRERLGADPDAVVVGHAGQLRPHKGQLSFARAASIAGDAAPGVQFAVLGTTTGASAYVAEVRAAGATLGDRLRFPGFVDDGPRGLNLLVFTSIVPDPFPLVVLEALAAGVPVIAFAAGGVPEAVADGIEGRLVAPGADAALAAAITELTRDPGRRREMAIAARRRAESEFDAGRVAARYGAVLDEVVGG